MAEAPHVSVVMPCFNARPYLAEAVGCALGQSAGHPELIVVDDGSTDGCVELLAELQRTHGERLVVLHQAHGGPYPARNRGLAVARGEFVAFLDADDTWRPDFLQRMLAALEASGADLAYCGWQNFGDGAPGTEPYVPPAYEAEDPVAHFLRACPWPIHAALVRRSVLTAVDGFSVRRFSSMDYDLWLRILGHTRRMVRVPEVMAFYRWHGKGQVSAVKWRQVLDAEEAQRGFVARHPALVRHLDRRRLHELIEGRVLQQAYRAVWARDLDSAQRLFRHATLGGGIGLRDLRHVVAAWLPPALYRRAVGAFERHGTP